MRLFVTWVVRGLVRALALTWRVEVEGREHLERLRATGEGFVFTLWHRTLIPLTWQHRAQGVTLLVSDHRDGGRLVDVARRWGYRIVRGSSTRGGARGLRGMLRALRAGAEVAVTPDGPRGPAGIVKPGALALARTTGSQLLPVAAAATSAWYPRSWDRLLVPLPFARVTIVYADPVSVAGDANSLDAARRQLTASLDAAAARAARAR